MVEFQPSGWGKGSYLNVGAMWFWHSSNGWVFSEFNRAAPFHEFHDGAQFAEVASTLAQQAATQVLQLRQKFSSIDAVAAYLTHDAGDGLWANYHAAMAASLAGDVRTAASHFDALAAVPAVAPWEWVREVQARAKRLSESCASATSARAAIGAEVALARKNLGLSEWPTDRDIWAPITEMPV